MASQGASGHRLRNAAAGVLKQVLRGPLGRVRSFLIGPVTARLEAIQGALLARERFIAEASERLLAIEQRIGALDEQLGLLQQHVGFLHGKADESALKSRPLLHLQDAYAAPLADGYIFIPQEEEVLLLMYAGASSAGLEPGTRRVLQTVLEPGGHAIDVGASVGLHTIALARAVGSSGRVDAFEAEPRLVPFLTRTLSVNGMAQVHLHNVALGAKDGSASFNVARTIGHSSLYDLGEGDLVREQIQIPLKRLDTAIAASKVDLIKIDVEGAELDVLRGAARILTECPECAIVAECGPSHLKRVGQTVEGWFSEFAKFGFEPFSITEPDGLLHEVEPRWAATQYSVNVLFVRPRSRSWEKCRLKLLRDRR